MESSRKGSVCLFVAFLAFAIAEASSDIQISATRTGMQGPHNSSVPFLLCANGGSRFIMFECETSLNDSVDDSGNITDPFLRITWPNGTHEEVGSDLKHLNRRSKIYSKDQNRAVIGYRHMEFFHPPTVGVFNVTCVLNATDGSIKESDGIEVFVEPDPHASSSPRVHFLNDVEMRNGNIIEGQDLQVTADLCCDTSNKTHNFTCSLLTFYSDGRFSENKGTAFMPIKAAAVNFYYDLRAGSILNCTISMHPESTCEQKEFNVVYPVVSRDPSSTDTTPGPNINDNNGASSKSNSFVAGVILLVLSTLAL